MNLLIYRTSPENVSCLKLDEKNLPCDATNQMDVIRVEAMLSAVLDNAHVEHCLILDGAGVVYCTPAFEAAAKNTFHELCKRKPEFRDEIVDFMDVE